LTPDSASLELSTIKKWGLWQLTLCRIYLFQGYNKDYGVGDHLSLRHMGIYIFVIRKETIKIRPREMGYPSRPGWAWKDIPEDADPFAEYKSHSAFLYCHREIIAWFTTQCFLTINSLFLFSAVLFIPPLIPTRIW